MRWRDPFDGRWPWEPPGGGIEPGGAPLAAARRELADGSWPRRPGSTRPCSRPWPRKDPGPDGNGKRERERGRGRGRGPTPSGGGRPARGRRPTAPSRSRPHR
ncbi:NUDIX domain-containing protein [Streptomyces triticirhizae]|uniref:NUDIX domain-containing protein n=1 Tax=Streptomyces triticirhizae TaxID=2483353 RepID=UPI001F44CA3F|nr:NUDIX domain-containing protein [Streptomyces triticirhizae]